MKRLLQIHPSDNVAVATQPIEAGASIGSLVIPQAVPMGHKVALVPLQPGDMIVKYGFQIGHATASIGAGEHVHSHNIATNLGADTELDYSPVSQPTNQSKPVSGPIPTFDGYRRPDGRAATRNEIWIINTVACVNVPSQRIAEQASKRFVLPGGPIDGIYAFTHPYGCSQLGDDLAHTRKVLASLARHPNAAAVLVFGLGCENNTLRVFLDQAGLSDSERVKFFNAQEVGDEIEHGLAAVEELVAYASQFKREPISASELVLGMKCGGSDGFSGITANPLVGRIAERLTSWGGSVILTEVPEMFGAEAALFSRCDKRETFDGAVAMVNEFKDYFRRHNEPIYENPSPGNKEGGITTLEEKSLGCIQKGGLAPVRHIAGYAEAVPQRLGGLALVLAPGNDGVSATALTAAGAHCVLFTTGRGTPLGVPVPTMKIASNSVLAERKPTWIDYNAGCLLSSQTSLDVATDELMQLVLDIASGRKQARNEINGFREITIWKQGVTL